MSISLDLQDLLLNTLKANAAIMDLINGIWDRPPDARFAAPKERYISFGPGDVVDDGADCVVGTEHTQQLDVWSRKPGFPDVKRIADLVRRALHEKELVLPDESGAVVEIRVPIVRYMRDPDGLTSHAAITVSARLEEQE